MYLHILGILALVVFALLTWAVYSGRYHMPPTRVGSNRWLLFFSFLAFNILIFLQAFGLIGQPFTEIFLSFIIGTELIASLAIYAD